MRKFIINKSFFSDVGLEVRSENVFSLTRETLVILQSKSSESINIFISLDANRNSGELSQSGNISV